jgi:hypothetical protein
MLRTTNQVKMNFNYQVWLPNPNQRSCNNSNNKPIMIVFLGPSTLKITEENMSQELKKIHEIELTASNPLILSELKYLKFQQQQ